MVVRTPFHHVLAQMSHDPPHEGRRQGKSDEYHGHNRQRHVVPERQPTTTAGPLRMRKIRRRAAVTVGQNDLRHVLKGIFVIVFFVRLVVVKNHVRHRGHRLVEYQRVHQKRAKVVAERRGRCRSRGVILVIRIAILVARMIPRFHENLIQLLRRGKVITLLVIEHRGGQLQFHFVGTTTTLAATTTLLLVIIILPILALRLELNQSIVVGRQQEQIAQVLLRQVGDLVHVVLCGFASAQALKQEDNRGQLKFGGGVGILDGFLLFGPSIIVREWMLLCHGQSSSGCHGGVVLWNRRQFQQPSSSCFFL
mmetsp:Transcript_4018/g.8202  ORF Transcript_4018/g.8202 Transcript_4018/m.8202 type:complete len:309 (+) Transcript_4018:355-1281(+)